MPISRALSTLKVPGRRALLQVPQNRSPYIEMPVYRDFSKYLSGSPGVSPLLQVTVTVIGQQNYIVSDEKLLSIMCKNKTPLENHMYMRI